MQRKQVCKISCAKTSLMYFSLANTSLSVIWISYFLKHQLQNPTLFVTPTSIYTFLSIVSSTGIFAFNASLITSDSILSKSFCLYIRINSFNQNILLLLPFSDHDCTHKAIVKRTKTILYFEEDITAELSQALNKKIVLRPPVGGAGPTPFTHCTNPEVSQGELFGQSAESRGCDGFLEKSS